MVLGPTGSGKTTLLAKLARESASPPAGSDRQPTPTLLLLLRQPLDEGAAVMAQRTSDAAGYTAGDGQVTLRQLQAIAARIYDQIGFPQRHSVAFRIVQLFEDLTRSEKFIEIRVGPTVTLKVPWATVATRERLQEALAMLYRVCEELQAERMKKYNLSRLDASCVVIIDEVQDLIKDKRLAAAGGRAVFADIGTLAVAYGVDMKAVRTVVAGSSASLAQDFARTSPATHSRWVTFTLADPAPAAVRERLKARGYTDEESGRILSVCGTRLRLLEEPLESTSRPTDIAQWTATMERMAARSFDNVMFGFPAADWPAFVDLLESVALAETHGKGVPFFGHQQLCGRSGGDITQVLYLDDANELHFQSELHSRVWNVVKAKYGVTVGVAASGRKLR